jgi:hypothetical protein
MNECVCICVQWSFEEAFRSGSFGLEFLNFLFFFLLTHAVSLLSLWLCSQLLDFGWKWFAPSSKDAFDKKREAELLNGRLAMFAIGGIATQSVLSGHGFPYL